MTLGELIDLFCDGMDESKTDESEFAPKEAILTLNDEVFGKYPEVFYPERFVHKGEGPIIVSYETAKELRADLRGFIIGVHQEATLRERKRCELTKNLLGYIERKNNEL